MSEEEKKQNEVVDLNDTGKIGFNTPAPVSDDPDTPAYKKKIKFSNQRKTALQKATFGFFIPSTIASILALGYFFLPFVSALVGIMMFFIIGVIIIVPIIFTCFIILVSDEYRSFVGKAWSVVEWFFDVTNHIAELTVYFPFVAIPALILEVIELILAITTTAKGQKGCVAYLVLTAVFFTILSIITVIYFVGGMKIIQGQ